MADSLTLILDDLVSYQPQNVTNIYRSCEAANCHATQRKANIEIYLSHFLTGGCSTLLVGEAPGYRGCRVTGIPFTSEYILENDPFFRSHFQSITIQHHPCREYGMPSKREASATYIWKALMESQSVPLPCCWNIFPLHPYDKGKGMWSNRTPTEQEIEIGSEFTQRLIALLKPSQIIAVGGKSYQRLKQVGIAASAVRHPANGGGSEFHSGLTGLLKS